MKVIQSNEHDPSHKIIDRDALFSQCHFWQWQRHLYQQSVETVWNNLPYGTSSNTVQAKAYVQHIQDTIKDCAQHHGWKATDPFYIIELGAGHGLLSYFIMEQIECLDLRKAYPNIRQILLDQTPKRLNDWRQSQAFQAAEQAGQLDFAIANVGQLNRAILINQQVPLQHILQQHPCVIIIHYLLDSLPTNTYYTDDDGKHHEVRYTISSPTNNLNVRMRPKSLTPITYSTSLNPIPEKPYHDPHLNALLPLCLAQQAPDSFCHFPVTAIELLNQLNDTQQPCWIHIQDIFDHSDIAMPFTPKHLHAWYQAIDSRWIKTWAAEQNHCNVHTALLSEDLTWLGITHANMPLSSQGITNCFYEGMIGDYTKAVTRNTDTPIETLLEAIERFDDPHLLFVTLERHEAYFRSHPDTLRTILNKAPQDLSFLPQKNRCGHLLTMYHHHLNDPKRALHYYQQLSKASQESDLTRPHGLWCYEQNKMHMAYARLKRQDRKQMWRRRWRITTAWIHLQTVRVRRAILWMTLPIALVLYFKGVGLH